MKQRYRQLLSLGVLLSASLLLMSCSDNPVHPTSSIVSSPPTQHRVVCHRVDVLLSNLTQPKASRHYAIKPGVRCDD